MKIVAYGVPCHSDFKLLPSSYMAITLFGHAFFRMSADELTEFVKTDHGHRVINHEHIHILQAESFKTKYFGFYLAYLWYWIINGFDYYGIPFEIEADKNERDYSYNETHWKDYR